MWALFSIGLRAGEIMCMLCDTHIYENQVQNIMEQLKRKVHFHM